MSPVGDFFRALATKLAERWATLLLVPGALFAVAAWFGVQLTHAHALDWHAVRQHTTATTAALTRESGATQAVLVAVGLLVATGVGLAVPALAGVTRMIWLGQWPRPFTALSRWRVDRRAARWRQRVERRRELESTYPRPWRTDEQQRQINTAAAQANGLSWTEPGRPTWMGDRGHSVEQIALNRYGLDLPFAWPRLWLVLPDVAREELTASNAAFVAAVATGTWAFPYLLLGTIWWPAAVVGVLVGITGWARARSAVAEFAALTEATLDLHARALAVAIGVADKDTTGPLQITEGQRISTLVRKGR